MPSTNLMTPSEEEAVKALQELIELKTVEARKRVIEILSKHITISYYLGAERAIDDLDLPIKPTSIGVQGLDSVINELSPILEETFGYMAEDLTSVIEEGVKNNLSYQEIKLGLQDKLKVFGERIPFKNAGKTREYVKVSPDGKLRLAQKKVTRNISIKTENYANLLARTSIKKAYALGHVESYKAAGLSKWRYSSVADERTRPRHLALHGNVYEVGSEEEQLALMVMGEANCRCRPIAFFNDPQIDRPQEEYIQEKREWAQKALDEIGDKDSQKAKFLEKMNLIDY